MQGADIVLTEGYKSARLFPRSRYSAARPRGLRCTIQRQRTRSQWVAVVTDDPDFRADCPVLHFQDTIWLQLLANLAWDRSLLLDQ